MKLHNDRKHRILSIVLCLLMVLALLPAAALAEEFSPCNGTVTNEYGTFKYHVPKIGNKANTTLVIYVNDQIKIQTHISDVCSSSWMASFTTADGYIIKNVKVDPLIATWIVNPFVSTNTYFRGSLTPAGGCTIKVYLADKNAAPQPAKVNLTAKKTLKGDIPGESEFSFELKADGEELKTAKNNSNGEVNFGEITFHVVGEYTYKISEVKGNDPKIAYDDTVYTVVYNVTLNQQDNKLEAVMSVMKNGVSYQGDILFENGINEGTETGTLDISKEINGLPIEKWPAQIEFKVTDTNDANNTYTVAVKKNNGLYEGGTINDLPYGEYNIKEDPEYAAVEGYNYTTTGIGNITVDKPNVDVKIINTYTEAEPKKGELTISKRANGLPYGQLPNSFTFEIMQGNNPIQQVTAKREGSDNTYKSDPIMLPYGEYTVVEKGAEIQGFILNATSDPADGKVTVSEKPQTIAFTNTYEMMNPEAGTLIVKKTVSGDGADYNKAFTFTVELKSPEFIVIPADPLHNNPAPSASPQPVVAKYGDVEFINGKATFTLKHNEKKTMTGILAGMTYTVTESDNAGYTVTVNGTKETTATGKIESGKTATAAFNNYKAGNNYPDTTFVYVNKVWMDGGSVRRPNSVTVQLYCNGKPYSLTMFGRVVDDGRAVLSAANGWQYTWRGLDDRYNWTVGEVDVPYGYVCNVTHGGNYWTITNTAVSGVLPPQTGDNNSTTLWLALLLISGSALAGTVVFIRRRKRT